MENNEATKTAYAATLKNMAHFDLIAALESCARQNTYGSHDEQAEMVRTEMYKRMTHY